MTTIQLEVSHETVARWGQQTLIERHERLLAWEEFQPKAVSLKEFLNTNVDNDAVSEVARSRSWNTYKNTVLKDVFSNE